MDPLSIYGERDVGLYIKREGWDLLKIPLGDIDGVGEVK